MNAIPIKIPMAFFTDQDQIILNCDVKRPQTVKIILRKNNKAGSVIFPNFKLYYKGNQNSMVLGIPWWPSG